MPSPETTEKHVDDASAKVRRLSVVNSVLIATGGHIARGLIEQAVEDGERVWRDEHLETLANG